MSKGTYRVCETGEGVPPRKDTSFRSCLCALLIFFAICLIIAFAAFKWGGGRRSVDGGFKKEPDQVVEKLESIWNGSAEASQKLKSSTSSSIISNEIEKNVMEDEESGENFSKEEFIPILNSSKEDATEVAPKRTDITTIKWEDSGLSEFINGSNDHGSNHSLSEDNRLVSYEVSSTKSTTKEVKEFEDYEDDKTEDSFSQNSTTQNITVTQSSSESTTLTQSEDETSTYKATTLPEYSTTKITPSKPSRETTPREIHISGEISDVFDNYSEASSESDVQRPSTPPTEVISQKEHSTATPTTQSPAPAIPTSTSPRFTKPPEPVCNTSGCKSAASRILSLMDHSVGACEDFYEYSCGGSGVFPEDNADSDAWERIQDRVDKINNASSGYQRTFRSFYDSCVSFEWDFNYDRRVSGVKEMVNEAGAFLKEEDPAVDLTNIFAKLTRAGSNTLFDIGVDLHEISGEYVFQLTLPQKSFSSGAAGLQSALSENQRRCLAGQRDKIYGSNLNLTGIYDSYLSCLKNHSVYLNFVETVLRALGLFDGMEAFNATQKVQDLRTTIEWDILDHLNDLKPAEIRRQIVYKEYRILKISTLQTNHPLINWKTLFQSLVSHPINDNTLVQVYFTSYFPKLFAALSLVPKWKLHNALLSMYATDLFRTLVLAKGSSRREDVCLKQTAHFFQDVAADLYMSTFPENSVAEHTKVVNRIFKVLQTEIAQSLLEQEWLDESHGSIMAKAHKLTLTFYKEERDFLEVKYFKVETDKDYQKNFELMMKTSKLHYYNLQGQKFAQRHMFAHFMQVYDRKPTLLYAKDTIAVPMGMTRGFSLDSPFYLEMAKIGIHLAKEIGRQFDSVGVNYDMSLNAKATFSFEKFVKETTDLMSFSTTKEWKGKKVNFQTLGELSTNERISDSTALRLTTDAMGSLRSDQLLPWISMSLSKEKIFFVAAAQEFCKETSTLDYMLEIFESETIPASLRIENIVSNSQMFTDVFDCAEGSNMNDRPIKTQFPYLQTYDDYNYDSK